MFKKILVPLDGSNLSENGLKVAAHLAQATGGTLYLLQAIHEELAVSANVVGAPIMRPVRPLRDLTDSTLAYLNNLKEHYTSKTVTVQPEVAYVDPATAILNTASKENVDIIVMSTHGRSGVDRWLFGSVTEKVMRHAECPVLAVRSADLPTRFLIPLDRSSHSEAIIEPAVELAQAFEANVVLAHIQDTHATPPWGDLSGIGLEIDGLAELMNLEFHHRGEYYLEDIARHYAGNDVEIDVAYGHGNPAGYIIDLAERDACDLIAMSTHGRSGLTRFRYGSVTEKVLRHNERAMLIVRPHRSEKDAEKDAEKDD